MAKRTKKQSSMDVEQKDTVDSKESISQEDVTTQELEETTQAVGFEQNIAEQPEPSRLDNNDEGENVANTIETAEDQKEIQPEIAQKEEVVAEKNEPKQKSGGTAVALVALLIALGIGGAGYFFGQQKFSATEQQLNALQQNLKALESRGVSGNSVQTMAEMPTFEAEKAQIAKLEGEYQKSLEQISQLKHQQESDSQQLSGLQMQLKKLGATPKAEQNIWLLSDADFLLTNALRKIVIDYDINTAKSLLIEADKVLSQVVDPQILTVREALKADLNDLESLNQVDQNNVMQRLAQLANLVDDMPMLDNEQLATKESGDVSDSVEDWQKNIEKSADSFLSHFIRVSDKKQVQDKAFIAPNQNIYLRENIRLRLQIAILAVPRQQNELYKQSLEAVSAWVRSYFDVQSETVKNFLKEVDDLVDQSIYIDAPTKLQSLDRLKQKLDRRLPTIEKVELEVGKDVEQLKIKTPEATNEAQPVQKEQVVEAPQSETQQPEVQQ